jgi:hypothetical protein
VAHPGHELRVFGWLHAARPRVFVLTDGSGRTGRSRLPSTTRILREAGAEPASIYEPAGRDRPSPGAVYHEGDVLDPLIDGWTPGTSSFIVRRSTLLAVGGFDEELRAWNDYDLWLRLARAGHRFLAVRERLRIKHDLAGPQLTTDPVARLRSFQRLDRKWGGVIRSLRGARGFRRWRARGYASVQHAWLRRMEAAAVRGGRVEAWRCYLGMWRDVRWSRRGLVRGLTLAVLGPGGYASLRRRYDALDGFVRGRARRAAR